MSCCLVPGGCYDIKPKCHAVLGINQTRVLWVFPLEPMPFLYCNVLLYFLKPKIVLLDFLLGALAKYFEIQLRLFSSEK